MEVGDQTEGSTPHMFFMQSEAPFLYINLIEPLNPLELITLSFIAGKQPASVKRAVEKPMFFPNFNLSDHDLPYTSVHLYPHS